MSARMLTAKDIMMRKLAKLRPDSTILDAARLLLRKRVTGVPVVDQDGKLLGFLSELDVLRIVTSDDFANQNLEASDPVSDFMTPYVHTIPSEMDIFSIAHIFVQNRIRKLPVVENGVLVGLVRRRDVIAGIGKMRKRRYFWRRRGARRKDEPALYLSATDSSEGAIAQRLK